MIACSIDRATNAKYVSGTPPHTPISSGPLWLWVACRMMWLIGIPSFDWTSCSTSEKPYGPFW